MTSLKIAVLMNGFESPYTTAIKSSFETAIAAASTSITISTPIIDFFDPIIAQTHPDPAKYDLIVLSGGTADPMGSDAWVLKLQKYLQNTVAKYPKQKFVGICWGHQTTSISFGGSVGNMEGPEIGVAQIKLTAEGKKFFPFAATAGVLNIHEFHRRDIKIPAKGFVALAEGNQSFVNEANTFLTFQGHPELNGDLAKIFVENAHPYMGLEDGKKGALVAKSGQQHDGVKIWERILTWIGE